MHRVLITGAGGGIGRSLRETLRGVYPVLRLSDRVPIAPARDGEEVDQTDIADMAQVERMVAGVDGIIHLGGISGENSGRSFSRATLSASTMYSRRRAAPASSASSSRPSTTRSASIRAPDIDHRVVPRPDSRYGVSKAFGEALASLYADKHGIGFLCTRIGNFGTKPIDKRRLSIWISPRDYTQLVRIGLEHPDIRFEIVYGVSGNKRSWYDNANAYRLGYKPEDDSEPYAAEILAREATSRRTRSPSATRAARSAPRNTMPSGCRIDAAHQGTVSASRRPFGVRGSGTCSSPSHNRSMPSPSASDPGGIRSRPPVDAGIEIPWGGNRSAAFSPAGEASRRRKIDDHRAQWYAGLRKRWGISRCQAKGDIRVCRSGQAFGDDNESLADLLKSRNVASVCYFHTDHFEPWSFSIDEASARAVERMAAMARRSPSARRLSLFYSVFIPYHLDPSGEVARATASRSADAANDRSDGRATR